MNALLLAAYSVVLLATATTIATTTYEVMLTLDLRKLAGNSPVHECVNPEACSAAEVLEKVHLEYLTLRRQAVLGVIASTLGVVAVAACFVRLV